MARWNPISAFLKKFQPVEKSFSLKSPGHLKIWGADLLGVDNTSVSTPYSQSIWVYRAINIWMRVAQIPALLKDSTGNEIYTGPLPFLLKNPYPKMSASSFYELLILSLGNYGEFFILREDGTNYTGVPMFLQVVSPRTMSLSENNFDRSGRLVSWTYSSGTTRKTILKEGVIHERLPSPFDRIRGQSPLDALRLTVDADYASRSHNKWQMERHGRISGVLSLSEPMGQTQLDTLQKKWAEKYEGADNAGKTAIMDSNAKYQSMGVTSKDMDWMEGQKISREEICAAFGIPPNNAGILDKATYSNFEESTRSMWADTLIPIGRRIENRLNIELIQPNAKPGDHLEFDFVNSVASLQANETEKVDRYIKLVTQGKISPERAAELTGIKLGDVQPEQKIIWVSSSEVPASMASDPMSYQDPAPPPVKSVPEKKLSTTPSCACGCETGKPGRKESDNQDRPQFTEEQKKMRDMIGKSILRDVYEDERKINLVLKRFFFDQRSTVLKNLSKFSQHVGKTYTEKKALKEHDLQMLYGDKNWNDELKLRMKAPVSRLVMKGIKQIRSVLKSRVDVSAEIVETVWKQQSILFTKINEYTAEALTAAANDVLEAVATSEASGDLQDALREAFKNVYNNTEVRRRTIARTESLRALNGGRHEEMVAVGVAQKEWLSINDGATRESHIDLDGTIVDIDENFETINGVELEYPLDPKADASETINCRCSVVPVIPENGNDMTPEAQNDDDEEA